MSVEFGTVSHRTSVLSVSLDCTLETFTFGNCSSIYFITICKDISFDFLCKCVFCCIFKFKFSYISLTCNTCFFEVSLKSFINTMSVDNFFVTFSIFVNNFVFFVYECNLNCFVSVVFYCFNLCYYTCLYGNKTSHVWELVCTV